MSRRTSSIISERNAVMSAIRESDQNPTAARIPQPAVGSALKVVCEGAAGPAEGCRFEIRPGRAVTVGRGIEADRQLSDSLMSRRHFTIEASPDGYWLRDLESRNGTLLNGRAVSSLLIRDGDIIEAGLSQFHILLVPDGGPMPAGAPDQQTIEAGPISDEQAQSTTKPSGAARVLTTAAPPAAVSAAISGSPLDAAPPRPPESSFLRETAAEIAELYELEDEPKQLLNAEQSPLEFVQVLLEKKLHRDAAAFLAYGLPKRAAVWWACRCIRLAWGDALPPTEALALDAAELWLRDPSDANRRAAMAQAKALRCQTAASWAAVGAFWSEGSLAPPQAPVVPPTDDLTPRAVLGAVKLAALVPEPKRSEDNFQAFLAEALEVESGRSHWRLE
jgi:hypothetical protein